MGTDDIPWNDVWAAAGNVAILITLVMPIVQWFALRRERARNRELEKLLLLLLKTLRSGEQGPLRASALQGNIERALRAVPSVLPQLVLIALILILGYVGYATAAAHFALPLRALVIAAATLSLVALIISSVLRFRSLQRRMLQLHLLSYERKIVD